MKTTLLSFFMVFFTCSAWAQLPLELGGLELWVRGDSTMEIEAGRVSFWEDLSGNERDLVQPVFNWKPNPETDAIGAHRGVRFDGGNQRMTFPEISNIRSVVWIILEDDDAAGFRPVLGHSENYPFFRGADGAIWHDEFANTEIVEGITRLDFEPIDGLTTDFEPGYHVMNLVTTGDVMADQFAQDRSLNTRWKGVLVELMIFSEELSQEEIEQLESYLVDIYSPEFTPMEDVEVLSGFCPTELQASAGFESYTWSTGAQTESIEVNQSGWYWVDLKDQLGYRTRDSVLVSYPGNLSLPQDSIICLGESFEWDLELDNSYAILWTNGQESSAVEQFEELTLLATITDENSCETTTNELNLLVDSLDALLSIGEIEDLCEGNILMPVAGNQVLLNVVWNDTDEQDYFEVNQSGDVWVELTDENGCIGRDTLSVNIIGAAPQLEITMPNVRCNGLEFNIDAQIDTPDGVDELSWTINDEEVGNTETLTFFAENPDSVTLDLYVSTGVGCFNQISETFEVFETPELGFNSSLNCAFSTSQWVANSTVEMTDLQSINWQYNGDSYSGIVVNPELAESGFSDLTMSATSINGCIGESTFSINALPVAEIEIMSEGSCLSDLVQFTSTIETSAQTGAEVYRQWNFGDFGVSSQQEPLHLYTSPGDFTVALEIETDNGCRAVNNYELTIFEEPEIYLPSLTPCSTVPIEAELNVQASDDPLAIYEWAIEELGTFSDPSPTVLFENSDFYSVTLNVESENGCRASASTVYTVFDLPVPGFSFTPEIGLAPLEISFINESSGAIQYEWDFGDSNFSSSPGPFHTYENLGTYDVTLVATNSVGCSASTSQSILVAQPQSDLIILDMVFEQQNNWVETSVLVLNNSNYTSASRNLLLNQNGAEILEIDSSTLNVGESKWYTFTALRDANVFNVLCVNVEETLSPSQDLSPEDNLFCKAIEDQNFEWLDPFPSPLNDELNARFITSVDEKFTITVSDNTGRIIFESSTLNTGNGYQQYSIDARDWLPGMYVLNYSSNLRQFSSRIIKSE